MIVKIQLPIITTAGKNEPQVLMYNEDLTINVFIPLSKELKRKMRGEFKRYFNARYIKGIVHIDDEVGEQEW